LQRCEFTDHCQDAETWKFKKSNGVAVRNQRSEADHDFKAYGGFQLTLLLGSRKFRQSFNWFSDRYSFSRHEDWWKR